jgi:hypothetical protein
MMQRHLEGMQQYVLSERNYFLMIYKFIRDKGSGRRAYTLLFSSTPDTRINAQPMKFVMPFIFTCRKIRCTVFCGTMIIDGGMHKYNECNCSRSRRRAANGSKRMYLDYTHGLFIT